MERINILTLLLVSITFSAMSYPVIIVEPYELKEQFIESYTVVEPGEVRVSDWINQNIMVNQSFMDTSVNGGQKFPIFGGIKFPS